MAFAKGLNVCKHRSAGTTSVFYVMLGDGGLPGSKGSDGKCQFAIERLERMWIIFNTQKKLLLVVSSRNPRERWNTQTKGLKVPFLPLEEDML